MMLAGYTTITFGANTTMTYGPVINVRHGTSVDFHASASGATKAMATLLALTYTLGDLAYDFAAPTHEWTLYGPISFGGVGLILTALLSYFETVKMSPTPPKLIGP